MKNRGCIDANGVALATGDHVIAIDDRGTPLAGTVDAINPVLGDGVGVVPGCVRVGRVTLAPCLLRKATAAQVAAVQDAILRRADEALKLEKEDRGEDAIGECS